MRLLIKRLYNNRYVHRLYGIVKYWPEVFITIGSIFRFLLLTVKRETVLLVEPNTFHGVVLPGFCKYFQDLGYDVVLICRYENVKNNAFCRYSNRPKLFVFDPLAMRWILHSKKINAFEFVFFTSRQIFASDIRVWGDYLSYLGASPKARYGSFSVVHKLSPDKQYNSINTKEVFLLTPNTYKGEVVLMLNPHYFGEVKYTMLSQGKRVFIFVGEVSTKKNSIMALLNVVRQLEKKFEFEVWLVGKGADLSLSNSLPASVKTFGHLLFNDMYELLEKADFSLPLLDPRNDAHKQYLQGVTSGTRLLILGFLKVPIIHTEFAKVYDFSDEDSILHGDSGLMIAMERALTMTDNEYARLQKGLKILVDSVYKESLENLRKRIDERKLASS